MSTSVQQNKTPNVNICWKKKNLGG